MYLLAPRKGVRQEFPRVSGKYLHFIKCGEILEFCAEKFWNFLKEQVDTAEIRIYEYIEYISGILKRIDCFHALREKQVRTLLALYHACSR